MFGYDIGIVEGALPQLRDEMRLRLDEEDMVVATMVVGAIVGEHGLQTIDHWLVLFYLIVMIKI